MVLIRVFFFVVVYILENKIQKLPNSTHSVDTHRKSGEQVTIYSVYTIAAAPRIVII